MPLIWAFRFPDLLEWCCLPKSIRGVAIVNSLSTAIASLLETAEDTHGRYKACLESPECINTTQMAVFHRLPFDKLEATELSAQPTDSLCLQRLLQPTLCFQVNNDNVLRCRSSLHPAQAGMYCTDWPCLYNQQPGKTLFLIGSERD